MSSATPTLSSASPMATSSVMRVRPGPRYLPILLLLFVGSGCAALIYEVVWFQMLELAIGSSAVSIGVLLGTFMGGMCLGSLLFPRLAVRSAHPLRIYAILELAIGIVAALITLGMPLFDHLYVAMASPGPMALVIRAIVCAICLLPPTMLMGATLPAISRWIETTPRGVSWLGFFYGGNTVGAVVGCLLAGYYLLRHFDMRTATFVAVGINLAVGATGLLISMITTPAAAPETSASSANGREPSQSVAPVYLSIAFSGAAALGAEVIWTRLLSLLLGPTVYTFSLILAVFLAGLGIGSSVGSMLARSEGGGGEGDDGSKARASLAWCQILCALGIAWTAYAVTNGVPNWPVNPFLAFEAGYGFEMDLARVAWAILPATIFWGASFPLALAAAVSSSKQDPARLVGRVYAANTVGAIVGALLFSLVFIPQFGTQQGEHFLIGIAGLGALAAVAPALFGPANRRRASTTGILFTLIAAVALPAGAVLVLTHEWQIGNEKKQLDELPWRLVAYGRRILADNRNNLNNAYAEKLYVREGMNSSVAVTRLEDGQTRRFHVAGKVEASTLPEDMRLQLMLGHWPALFHPAPKKVLIVGCGAGVTAGCFILHPEVEKIVICEIEPLVPKVVATYFGPENNGVVTRKDDGKLIDPRVEIVYDDARHYILTTREKFDIITSDPIHPWVKGAATLYTKEYFDLVKAHLNPGGLVTQWVPLYESSETAVKSEIATFFQVFPNGTIWNNDYQGGGYDTIVMGSNGDVHIDVEALQKRLNERVIASTALGNSGFSGIEDILKTYAGRATELADWMSDAEINYDRNLRLQYLAGDALNNDEATAIIRHVMSTRKYPDDLLSAPPELEGNLKKQWGLTGKRTIDLTP